MPKKYLMYELRTRRMLFIFLFFSELAFMLAPHTIFGSRTEMLVLGVAIGYALSMGLSVLLPMLSLSFVHKKSSVDAFFALPVSRRDQLFSILAADIGFTVGSFIVNSLLLLLSTGLGNLTLSQYLLGLLTAALTLAALTIVTSLLFLMGNSIFDGVVMVGGYFLLPLAVHLVMVVLDQNVAGWDPLTDFQVALFLSPAYLAGMLTFSVFSGEEVEHVLLMGVLLAGYTAAALYGLKVQYLDRETERAENISEKPYAYPFLIHAFTFCFLFATVHETMRTRDESFVVLYVLLAFLYVVAQFVYQRKLRLTWQMGAFFLATLVAAGAFSWVVITSHGFNLSYAYDKNPPTQTARIEYYGYAWDQAREESYSYDATITITDREAIEALRREAIDLYYADEDRYTGLLLHVFQNGTNYSYTLPRTPEAIRRYAALGRLEGSVSDDFGHYKTITPEELAYFIALEEGDELALPPASLWRIE